MVAPGSYSPSDYDSFNSKNVKFFSSKAQRKSVFDEISKSKNSIPAPNLYTPR
jgi:hypothetical protein